MVTVYSDSYLVISPTCSLYPACPTYTLANNIYQHHVPSAAKLKTFSTCQGRCGQNPKTHPGYQCYCDSQCYQYSDCCQDYYNQCFLPPSPSSPSTTTASPTTSSAKLAKSGNNQNSRRKPLHDG